MTTWASFFNERETITFQQTVLDTDLLVHQIGPFLSTRDILTFSECSKLCYKHACLAVVDVNGNVVVTAEFVARHPRIVTLQGMWTIEANKTDVLNLLHSVRSIWINASNVWTLTQAQASLRCWFANMTSVAVSASRKILLENDLICSSNFPNLRRLRLHNCEYTADAFSQIPTENLEVLCLEKCFKDWPVTLKLGESMSNLRILVVLFCAVTLDDSINTLVNLEKLVFVGSHSKSLTNLEKLVKLKCLVLLVETNIRSIDTLVSLTHLKIDSRICISSVQCNTNLENLDIGNNHNIRDLSMLLKLRTFRMKGLHSVNLPHGEFYVDDDGAIRRGKCPEPKVEKTRVYTRQQNPGLSEIMVMLVFLAAIVLAIVMNSCCV